MTTDANYGRDYLERGRENQQKGGGVSEGNEVQSKYVKCTSQ